MPNQNTNQTVARSAIEVAGRSYDRSSALEYGKSLIQSGKPMPKDLAVFLREDKVTKKALVLVRAERKQHLINHGFTMITEAHARGFKVIGMTAPKKAANGNESFSVRLQKSGSDGKVSVVEIKTKLSAMSKAERAGILAELAQLQADAAMDEQTNAEATQVAASVNQPAEASAVE